MTFRRFRGPVLAAVAAVLALAAGCSGGGSTAAAPGVEQQNLYVAAVPAVDSAGFFIALYDGLFRAEGLKVHFIPATSSETVIDRMALSDPGAKGELDIICGGYVSYVEAQHNLDAGQRPSAAHPGILAADLDIFAEGALTEPGTVAIYTMPGSRIKTIADLKGQTVAINAPDNTLYLMAASALAENGIPPSDVHFDSRYPLPTMADALKAGKVDAVVLPEPFASAAEEAVGVVPLADLDQGATSQFPTEGYAVTKAWAAAHPKTLAAFYKALEEGQEIADTDRAALEQAMEDLPAPLAVPREVTAVMAIPSFPIATGPGDSVDATRLQNEVDTMEQFLAFPPFNIKSMLISG